MPNVNLSKPNGFSCWLAMYRLYRSAFPADERKPFGVIARRYREGKTDIWIIRQEGRFAGFAATVNSPKLILLDYLAVEKAKRSSGVGSGAMENLQQIYADRGLFVEIENTRENTPDQALRLRRKQFYLAAGMAELQVQAELFGVNMELLGSRCTLDFDGYKCFYRDYLSPWAAEHVQPLDK